ncbi:MAG: hypothetical protein WDA12_02935 [Bacilli bacterium]
MKLCKKCKERNLNKKSSEVSYCEKCSSNIRTIYIPKRVKPLAEHLRDIMIEQNKNDITTLDTNLLEYAMKRAGSRSSSINGSLLATTMKTVRGRELFEYVGRRYFPSTSRFYTVYELKDNV